MRTVLHTVQIGYALAEPAPPTGARQDGLPRPGRTWPAGAAARSAGAVSTARTMARAAGFEEVVDLSREGLRNGVARLTDGVGVDGVGGTVTGEALGTRAPGGTLVSVGYAGGMAATINAADLIWRTARLVGVMFTLFPQPTVAAATETLLGMVQDGRIRPLVDRVFPLAGAGDAQRFLREDGPFGRVLLGF